MSTAYEKVLESIITGGLERIMWETLRIDRDTVIHFIFAGINFYTKPIFDHFAIFQIRARNIVEGNFFQPGDM